MQNAHGNVSKSWTLAGWLKRANWIFIYWNFVVIVHSFQTYLITIIRTKFLHAHSGACCELAINLPKEHTSCTFSYVISPIIWHLKWILSRTTCCAEKKNQDKVLFMCVVTRNSFNVFEGVWYLWLILWMRKPVIDEI